MKDAELIKKEFVRKTVRLTGFDYGTDGAYLITLRSYKSQHIFSEIVNAEVRLTALGDLIHDELESTFELRKYATITEWVIMPNHVHCVVFIHKNSDEPEHLSPRGKYLYFPDGYVNKFGPQRENLASVIRGIKSAVTSRAKCDGINTPVWQPSFYEHIIRNEIELEGLVLYIRQNPSAWEQNECSPRNSTGGNASIAF